MYGDVMRTTISLDPDIVAAIQKLRQVHGLGLSEAVNTLARRGLSESYQSDFTFRSPAFEMGPKLDYTNTAELLDILDGH